MPDTATNALPAGRASMRAAGLLRLTREIRHPVHPSPDKGWTIDICMRVTVSGPVQAATGYVADAGALQRWVLSHAQLPAHVRFDQFDVGDQLARLWSRLASDLGSGLTLEELEMWVSPTWHWTVCCDPSGRTVQTMTRSFHFSAAHRICNLAWSEEDNLRVFGKCANPAGHGHNYVLDVSVDTSVGTAPALVENAVERLVLANLDHKHLNVDVAELQGANPTVEALTNLIWDALDGALPSLTLWSIHLHETPKISAARQRPPSARAGSEHP